MSLVETHAAALARFDADTLTGPDIPAAVFAYECDQTLTLLANPDIGPRIAKALRMPDVAAQLSVRTATFREAQQGWWLRASRRKPEEQAADELALSEAIQEALAQLEWWGRDDAPLLEVIDRLREGTGVADLLADGDDAARLLDDHAARLADADDYLPGPAASELRDLTARVRAGQTGFRSDTSQAALIAVRNRAFAWCEALLTEVRRAARFVFRKDKAIAGRFGSAYERRRNARRARKTVPAAPTTPV